MAKIIAPNKQYSGVSASVKFVSGVGETDTPNLVDWFITHGYKVVDSNDSEDIGAVGDVGDVVDEQRDAPAKKRKKG